MSAPFKDATNDAVQFLTKHGDLTRAAAYDAIRLLTGNGFVVTQTDMLPSATDLSQAAVAAALEAAARVMGERQALISREQVADLIRALITQPQHDALSAHVAAEVAKARAEDAAKIAALVDTVKRLNAACDAMWNDHERLEKNAGYFAGQQPWQLKDAHMRAISEAQQAALNTLNQIGAKP